jgi:hypothetical protein
MMPEPIEVEAEITDAATRFVEQLIDVDGASQEEAVRALMMESRALLDKWNPPVTLYISALQTATIDTVTLIGVVIESLTTSLFGNGQGVGRSINLAFNAALAAHIYNALAPDDLEEE